MNEIDRSYMLRLKPSTLLNDNKLIDIAGIIINEVLNNNGKYTILPLIAQVSGNIRHYRNDLMFENETPAETTCNVLIMLIQLRVFHIINAQIFMTDTLPSGIHIPHYLDEKYWKSRKSKWEDIL